MANADLLEFLRANTERGNWEGVVEKYAEDPEAQRLRLTSNGDTTLHLAVIDNQEEIVERLVKLICRSRDYKQLLAARNKSINSPLHLAAALGSARMCHVIASAYEDLVNGNNASGETPLFLAALYGHKDAFYCLYYFCRHNLAQATNNCSRSNRDTVLHFALKNEHFDLAFQLIHMHKDAAHWVDWNGFTPLHVLASKPSSFKSGAHICGWWKIVYNWIYVDRLKPQSIETLSEAWKKSIHPKKTNTTTSYFPANYHTCIHFFTSLWDGILKVSTLKPLVKKKNSDEANKDKDLEEHVDVETDPSSITREPPITNFPKIYNTCIDFCQIIFSTIMIILSYGFLDIRKIREMKQKHTWSVQVMEKLLEFGLRKPHTDLVLPMPRQRMELLEAIDFETPEYGQALMPVMLLATKYGVMELVMELYKRFRTTIHDTTEDGKNIVLLAAEYRQLHVYRFLLEKKDEIESLFRAVDKYGNSALHLAATARTSKHLGITGAALQMQWEVRWYKYVEKSVPHQIFALYNKKGKTASTIFEETHMGVVQKGEDWLYKTSQSCSVVATLIATVAFATAATVPGGNDDHGAAVLEKEQGFFIFSISSLIALCLSTTSIIMFLSILTSRFGAKDFGSNLPTKMLIGLSSLYFSIVAMLISFCSGHYFLIVHRLQNVATLLYTLTFLPIIFIFGILQLPLFFDLLKPIREIVPGGGAKDVLFN